MVNDNIYEFKKKLISKFVKKLKIRSLDQYYDETISQSIYLANCAK